MHVQSLLSSYGSSTRISFRDSRVCVEAEKLLCTSLSILLEVASGRILAWVGLFVSQVLDEAVVSRGKERTEEGTYPIDPMEMLEGPSGNTWTETSGWVERCSRVVNACKRVSTSIATRVLMQVTYQQFQQRTKTTRCQLEQGTCLCSSQLRA